MIGKELLGMSCHFAVMYWGHLKFPSIHEWIKKTSVCSECLVFCRVDYYLVVNIRSRLATCDNTVGTGDHPSVT